jgi:hypothetical protein
LNYAGVATGGVATGACRSYCTLLRGYPVLKVEEMKERACEWGCTTGNAATVAHSTKKTTSGKDSVIEGQPLLLFM